ncbi:hypothetical protein [Enterococcus gallinarum]|nr:hypothetical protein [Enterococcus gallinarum]MDV7742462.1 hypothetical protein [Enterococcus gallinarum]
MGRFCEPEVTRHLLRILLWYFMYIAAVKQTYAYKVYFHNR